MNLYKKYKQLYLEKQKLTSLILFKADWCSFCNEFENTWNTLQNKKKLKNVHFLTYDYSKDKKTFQKYNISKFPTIILINKKKENIEYINERSIDHLENFILNNML